MAASPDNARCSSEHKQGSGSVGMLTSCTFPVSFNRIACRLTCCLSGIAWLVHLVQVQRTLAYTRHMFAQSQAMMPDTWCGVMAVMQRLCPRAAHTPVCFPHMLVPGFYPCSCRMLTYVTRSYFFTCIIVDLTPQLLTCLLQEVVLGRPLKIENATGIDGWVGGVFDRPHI